MTYSAVYPPARRRFSALPVALLLAVCLIGGVLAMNLALNGRTLSLAPAQKEPGIADRVRTSFGFIEVESASAAASALANSPALSIDVQLGIMLENDAALPLVFSPSQFELLDINGNVIPQSSRPPVPGSVAPDATLGMSLHFVTNAAARPFVVRFVDRTNHRTLKISLGDLGCGTATPCAGVSG